MKLSELIENDIPELSETISKDDLVDKLNAATKQRFIDSMLQTLHDLVSASGNRQGIGSYAFQISREFGFNPKE